MEGQTGGQLGSSGSSPVVAAEAKLYLLFGQQPSWIVFPEA